MKISGFTHCSGQTDETGTLTAMIPPKARYGLLLLGEKREEITINFGYVDPIEEVSGVQTRLQNLGFYEGEIKDELSPETVAAIAEFQRSVELSGEGDLNEETRQKLVEAHGS
ncbi:MAG: peptidoglycan-binding protein [Pyrinomonadaceae bacterium]|nr:peptidoglycan-binding protein [Pyrinomonadaceae bacterium]